MNLANKNTVSNIFFVFALFSFIITKAQSVKRPPITGIAFVEFQVSDVTKAKTFYEQLLGYQMQAIKALANRQPFNITVNPRQSIQLIDGLPANQDERLVSLAFATPHIDSMRSYLVSRHIPVSEITRDAGNHLFITLKDPDGHSIKFMQYTGTGDVQPQKKAISSRILHVGLTIANARAADAFYKDVLGFSEIWRGGANDSVTSWINMHLPESTDYIEYMLTSGPVSRQQLGSMHHVALLVPDMQQALDVLNIRAVQTGYQLAQPRIGRNRRWQLNLFDADGTRAELMEPFPMK